MTNIKSGIYKITNPNNQVYIGQTTNLRRRLTMYMKLYSTIQAQGRIFESLTKHGPKQHKYEVIEFCSVYELDAQEVYHKKEHIDNYGWETALFCQVYDAPTKGRKRAEQDYYNQYGRPFKSTKNNDFKNFIKGDGEAFIGKYDVGHQPYDTL